MRIARVCTASPELERGAIRWVGSGVQAVVGAKQLRHAEGVDVEGVGGRALAAAENDRGTVRWGARGGKTSVVAIDVPDLSRGLSWGRSRGTGRGRDGR